MNMLLWNVLLAAVWAGLTGTFTLENATIGFVLSYFVLLIARRGHRQAYFRRTRYTIMLVGFIAWELVLANLRLAREVLRLRIRVRPGIVAIPLEAKTDPEITLLASLITLTPGTVALELSADRSTLYIHSVDVGDADAIRHEIKARFERLVLGAMR